MGIGGPIAGEALPHRVPVTDEAADRPHPPVRRPARQRPARPGRFPLPPRSMRPQPAWVGCSNCGGFAIRLPRCGPWSAFKHGVRVEDLEQAVRD